MSTRAAIGPLGWRALFRRPTVAMRLWQVLVIAALHAIAPFAIVLGTLAMLAFLVPDEPRPYANGDVELLASTESLLDFAIGFSALAILVGWWFWSAYCLVREYRRRVRKTPLSYLWLQVAPGIIILALGTLSYLGEFDTRGPREPALPTRLDSAR